MFKRLYDWTIALAQSPRATWALALVAFAESSFFPIPPDALLAPMALARPKRAFFYAGVCTAASVLGGVLGYAIGHLLYDTVGLWLIELYRYGQKVEAMQAFYAEWGWAFILVKGVSPIPFKLITIVSGLMHYDFLLFVLLCTVTRGARFFLVAGAMNLWGDRLRDLLERYFGAFLAIVVLSVVFGFWLAFRMF
jgi:membrane protein YqaA with SNARE-associated domain